jgi:hypothetical protein
MVPFFYRATCKSKPSELYQIISSPVLLQSLLLPTLVCAYAYRLTGQLPHHVEIRLSLLLHLLVRLLRQALLVLQV